MFQTVEPLVRRESSSKYSSTSTDTLKDDSEKKTWQIIFHPSNLSTGNVQIGKNHSLEKIFLQFSFLANDQDDQTEIHQINMTKFTEHFKSSKQYSFPVKFENIGQPEHIRLKIYMKDDDDDDDDDDIGWHLDHVCKFIIRKSFFIFKFLSNRLN